MKTTTAYKMLTVRLIPHRFSRGRIVDALAAVLGAGAYSGLLPAVWYGTADTWDDALSSPVLDLAKRAAADPWGAVLAERGELSGIGAYSLSLWSPLAGSTMADQKNYRFTCQFYVGDDSQETLQLASMVRLDFPIPESDPERYVGLFVSAFPSELINQVVGVEDDPGFMDRVLQNPGDNVEVRSRVFYP